MLYVRGAGKRRVGAFSDLKDARTFMALKSSEDSQKTYMIISPQLLHTHNGARP